MSPEPNQDIPPEMQPTASEEPQSQGRVEVVDAGGTLNYSVTDRDGNTVTYGDEGEAHARCRELGITWPGTTVQPPPPNVRTPGTVLVDSDGNVIDESERSPAAAAAEGKSASETAAGNQPTPEPEQPAKEASGQETEQRAADAPHPTAPPPGSTPVQPEGGAG
jgi:hypothetical protein